MGRHSPAYIPALPYAASPNVTGARLGHTRLFALLMTSPSASRRLHTVNIEDRELRQISHLRQRLGQVGAGRRTSARVAGSRPLMFDWILW